MKESREKLAHQAFQKYDAKLKQAEQELGEAYRDYYSERDIAQRELQEELKDD